MLASAVNSQVPFAGGPGHRRRLPLLRSAILALFLIGWSAAIAAASLRDEAPSDVRGTSDIRELFRSGSGPGDTRVGRLAIQLVQGGTVRQVGLNHHFRTGDRFRFSVSSNHAGWLYVLHRSPAGEPQLLWPRLSRGGHQQHLDDNRLEAGQAFLIPPAPGVFRFDEEVGNEYFYVVIQPERRTPKLSALALHDPSHKIRVPTPRPVEPAQPDLPLTFRGEVTLPVPATSQQKIVQFSVKGMGAGQTPMRGVVFLPGGEDADPNAYFAPDPKDEAGSVVFEFRLRHGD